MLGLPLAVPPEVSHIVTAEDLLRSDSRLVVRQAGGVKVIVPRTLPDPGPLNFPPEAATEVAKPLPVFDPISIAMPDFMDFIATLAGINLRASGNVWDRNQQWSIMLPHVPLTDVLRLMAATGDARVNAETGIVHFWPREWGAREPE